MGVPFTFAVILIYAGRGVFLDSTILTSFHSFLMLAFLAFSLLLLVFSAVSYNAFFCYDNS